jgi:hypothetical protein
VFYLLSRGQAMKDFEGLKDLFIVIKVKHTPKKHWINFSNWGIVESMNDLLLQYTRNVINVVDFLSMNADEMTTINNASCISLHIYVVQAWKQIPFLVCVEMVEV